MSAVLASVTAPSAAPARFEMYGPIHKALRLFLGETLASVGRLDWQDPAELAATLDQVEALVALLENHLRHEDEFLHPFMQARVPGSAARAAAEHHDHREALAELALEARLLRQRPSAAQAGRLYQSLALILADNLQHMHLEDGEYQQLLWRSASDAELLALHERLVASIPPQEFFTVLHWMLPALNPQERAEMLLGMRAGAPAEVFEAVLGLARQRLDGAAWAKLEQALAGC
jgi:hypothetical protein